MTQIASAAGNVPQPPSNCKTAQVFDEHNRLLDWSTCEDEAYARCLMPVWWGTFGKNIRVEFVSECGERRLVEPQG